MITERKKRIYLYVIVFASGMVLQVINYLLYLYKHLDGVFLLCLAIWIPVLSFFFTKKLKFGQCLIATASLAFTSVIMGIADGLLDGNPDTGGTFLYGLGWVLSVLVWFFGPFAFQLLVSGITALVRILKENSLEEKG